MLLAVVMALSMSVSALAAEPNKVSTDAQEAPVASSELVILRDENGEVHFEVPNDNSIDPRIPGLANIVAKDEGDVGYLNDIDYSK